MGSVLIVAEIQAGQIREASYELAGIAQEIASASGRDVKSLVMGKISAAIFLEVFNVLNSDDLHIFTVEPTAPEFRNPSAGNLDPENVLGPIQLDATRRFGRRFQVGLQFDF